MSLSAERTVRPRQARSTSTSGRSRQGHRLHHANDTLVLKVFEPCDDDRARPTFSLGFSLARKSIQNGEAFVKCLAIVIQGNHVKKTKKYVVT
jgi:hypothetical protein